MNSIIYLSLARAGFTEMLIKEFLEENIQRYEKNGTHATLIICSTLWHMYKKEILPHPALTTVSVQY
ncbi:hypothetical protein MUP77_12815 [Candidatus Bathyarchaeota archaeon]|nr:hypothetical protein [Candidatus Bathyarchaeota archaeon]